MWFFSSMQALELDSNNEKGLFRRGEAHLAVNDFELARADFQKVIQLYPSNKAAKVQLVTCQQKIREQHEKEKKMYANMFQRLADRDLRVSNITPEEYRRWCHMLDKEWCFRYSAYHLVQINTVGENIQVAFSGEKKKMEIANDQNV